MTTAPDPTRTSHYVTDAFYEALVAAFTGWERDEDLVRDPGIRDEIARLLTREARLLDRHAYDDWLAVYAPECIYWVPATPEAGDPRREVAVMFDDRRRMEDRVYRLKTGAAWSQMPRSRTAHFVSNVEVFASDEQSPLMVRSNLLVIEFRAGDTRTLAGWCAHRLRRRGDGWEVLVKQVNLLECDQNLRNPSFIL
jgi:benzoate/toluate 1,2-dioxygenase beta subunit